MGKMRKDKTEIKTEDERMGKGGGRNVAKYVFSFLSFYLSLRREADCSSHLLLQFVHQTPPAQLSSLAAPETAALTSASPPTG